MTTYPDFLVPEKTIFIINLIGNRANLFIDNRNAMRYIQNNALRY